MKALNRFAPALMIVLAMHATSAASYTLELEARADSANTGDPNYQLPPDSEFYNGGAAINDADDVVAFVMYLDVAINAFGVWSGAHGAGDFVTTSHAAIDGDPSVNDAGQIAFITALPFLPYIYGLSLYDPVVGIIPLSGDSIEEANIEHANVNANGDVAITVDEQRCVVFSDAVPTDYVVAGVGNTYGAVNDCSLSDAGLVAAAVITPSGHEIRLFASDGSSTRILADHGVDPSSPYSTLADAVAVNAAGEVAVRAIRVADGQAAIVRSNGTQTVEIAAADASGPLVDIPSVRPAINSAGQVAFRAHDAAGDAIYVGDGATLVRVAGFGEGVMIDLGRAELGADRSDQNVFDGAPSINAHGDVAFVARLHAFGHPEQSYGRGAFAAYAPPRPDAIFADGFD